MAEYSSFVYGSGITYGTQVEVENVEPISDNLVLLQFSEPVVVDSTYFDVATYNADVVEGTGDIAIRSVLPFKDESTTADNVILVTDNMTPGTQYRFTATAVNARDGRVASGAGDLICRRTKLDSIKNLLPKHFDRSPESVIQSIMRAITQVDEQIGGARSDTFEYGTVTLPGRLATPTVAFTLAITDTLCPNSPPTGTFTDATRIALFVDGVYYADATLDTALGTWSTSLPTALLTHGVAATLRAAAIGPGGVVEEITSPTPDLQAPAVFTLDSHTTPDTDTNPITFFGTTDPGATVTVSNVGSTYTDSAVADGGGNWNMGAETLPVGADTYTFVASDACGNETSPIVLSLTVS